MKYYPIKFIRQINFTVNQIKIISEINFKMKLTVNQIKLGKRVVFVKSNILEINFEMKYYQIKFGKRALTNRFADELKERSCGSSRARTSEILSDFRLCVSGYDSLKKIIFFSGILSIGEREF